MYMSIYQFMSMSIVYFFFLKRQLQSNQVYKKSGPYVITSLTFILFQTEESKVRTKAELPWFNMFNARSVKYKMRQRRRRSVNSKTIKTEAHTCQQCYAIVNASHKEENPPRDQPTFREKKRM